MSLMLSENALPALDHAAVKRGYFRIMDAWGVGNEDARTLLGRPGRSTFFAYKKGQGGKLSVDELSRVSYVLGIYKALQLLFRDPSQADAWMGKPNEVFGGASALQHALGGQLTDLAEVRSYLDAVRGQGA